MFGQSLEFPQRVARLLRDFLKSFSQFNRVDVEELRKNSHTEHSPWTDLGRFMELNDAFQHKEVQYHGNLQRSGC